MGIKRSIGDGSSFRYRPHLSGLTFLAIAMIAMLALAVLLAAAPGQAQDQSAEPLWSADMLVAEITSVSIGADGADHFSNIGGTGNLQLKSLWSYTPDRDLRLAFEEVIPDTEGWTLQVGDLVLEFPEGSSGQHSFMWTGVDVDWKDGQTISARIFRASATTNTPATGAPAISGTAQVNETLTTDTTAIEDADGLANVSYSYQWVRNDGTTDTDIQDADASTYTVSDDDVGETIKVRVSITDDANNQESRTSPPTATVIARPNSPATGAPTISGTAQVAETLTANTSGIADQDGLDDVSYSYQWLADDADIQDGDASTYTVSDDDVGKTIKVRVSFTDDANYQESLTSAATTAVSARPNSSATCPGGAYDPVPTPIEVEAVPILIKSTADDYFVLYARHDLDADTSVEIPVAVTLGQAGTTTLAENVAPLPKERYRVEKFVIADPADVDGDCIDDITELNSLGEMNPVNPSAAIDLNDGAVAMPDSGTFNSVGQGTLVKFMILDTNSDHPSLYFINSKTHSRHLSFLKSIGLESKPPHSISGTVIFYPDLRAPSGSMGVYPYDLGLRNYHKFNTIDLAHTLLSASMALLDNNLAHHVANPELAYYQQLSDSFDASRVEAIFDQEIFGETSFADLNEGQGYGLLRVMELDERPNPRDVVIYEALPNDLPLVAGIITTVPQTPLSHVNLRAVQGGIPNIFLRYALSVHTGIPGLIGKHVHFEVYPDGYSIREATLDEVNAHYEGFPAHHYPDTPAGPVSHTDHRPGRHRIRRLGSVRRQGGKPSHSPDTRLSRRDRT